MAQYTIHPAMASPPSLHDKECKTWTITKTLQKLTTVHSTMATSHQKPNSKNNYRYMIYYRLYITLDMDDDNYLPNHVMVAGGELEEMETLSDTRITL